MSGVTVVTGGAGFIGSHLVRLARRRGERVRVLDRPGAKLDHLPLDRIDVVPADIRDRDAVRRAAARLRRRLPPRGQPATLDAPPRPTSTASTTSAPSTSSRRRSPPAHAACCTPAPRAS